MENATQVPVTQAIHPNVASKITGVKSSTQREYLSETVSLALYRGQLNGIGLNGSSAAELSV